MQLYSVNFLNQNTKFSDNKIAFKSNDDFSWYEDTQSDTFEFSGKKSKKQGIGFVNPFKRYKMQAQTIISDAREQASKIIAKAHKDAIEARESLEKQAKQDGLCLANEEYLKRVAVLNDEFSKLHSQLENGYYQKNTELMSQHAELSEKLQQTRELISAINQGYIEQEIAQRKEQIMDSIDAYTLDYDYTPETHSLPNFDQNSDKKIDLAGYEFQPKEKQIQTSLEIPEFAFGEDWNFEVPKSEKINLGEYERMDFSEVHNHETNISMNYADSIKWNTDKIARDLMQNFFDGHGQTLDGVRISFEYQENGKYKVRIEGDAQYSQEKAILLGESTKRNNSRAAGNFGEGLKVVVLKLLKEYGACDVQIASDNWLVDFKSQESAICKKDILSYSLLKQEPIDGNYIEFETGSEELLGAIRNSINNFYHSNNPDFQNLDFENDYFGIKFLDDDEKGSIYIAGQKFEYFNEFTYDQGWSALDGMNIIFKQKPRNSNDFDISRDRIMLKKSDLASLLEAVVASENTTSDDICELLYLFRNYWKNNARSYKSCNLSANYLFDAILKGICKKGLKFKFPKGCLAANVISSAEDDIYKNSKEICKSIFANIGMKTLHAQYLEDKPNALIEPNEFQIKKIALIKEVLKTLKPHIVSSDIRYLRAQFNPNIYIFKENGILSGEHRKDGFWIGESELSGDFDRIISTALHEICHEFGGDGSADFTYALTDMLEAIIKATTQDEHTLIELRALRACWDEIRKQEINSYLLNN